MSDSPVQPDAMDDDFDLERKPIQRVPAEQRIHDEIVELDGKLRQLALEARALAVPILRDRKFDLESQRGWEDLLDAARSASKSAATDSAVLAHLQCLASAWIQTQTRLSFFSRTRPGWNT